MARYSNIRAASQMIGPSAAASGAILYDIEPIYKLGQDTCIKLRLPVTRIDDIAMNSIIFWPLTTREIEITLYIEYLDGFKEIYD